jgi:hypothetical protein
MNLEQIRWWRAQEARTDFEIALCDAALKGLQAEVVQFSPTGDNHHNAWKCPYCRPEMEKERPAIIEECARVCDELYSDTAWHPYYRQAANNCAETIRAKIHQWRDIKVVGKDAIRDLAPREQNAATQDD